MNEYPEAPIECCRHAENGQPAEANGNPDITIRRCRVCGRRHFEAIIDPHQIGIHEDL